MPMNNSNRSRQRIDNKFLSRMIKHCEIQHLVKTPYYLQENGQVDDLIELWSIVNVLNLKMNLLIGISTYPEPYSHTTQVAITKLETLH